jgi:hypothetical protein
MPKTKLGTLVGFAVLAVSILIVLAEFPLATKAQSGQVSAKPPAAPTSDSMRMSDMADHAMSGTMSTNVMKHMEMTPSRPATHEDSVRATRIVAQLKQAIAKYQDTAVAVADDYKMFLPNVKTQKIYHFTNNGRAFMSAFHFDPSKPTSVLYKRGADGKLHLVGAMYTLGKNASLNRLNDRVPLSIAHWHKHVNWCVPKKGDDARWTASDHGQPVFGPESPIATNAACDAVNGTFHPSIFGWMLHANVFEGGDLGTIFGDDHGEHRAEMK